MPKPLKKQKEIKAWAVVNKRGKIIGDGWGTLQSWIFSAKWMAVQELENATNSVITTEEKEWKIVPITLKLD